VKKKKPEKKSAPEKPAHEKPAHELTSEEAITRLFPKPFLDKVRHDLDLPSKPPKLSIHEP